MTCAKTCLKRYWWSYIKGYRKAKKSEALTVGTLFHDSLEAGRVIDDPGYPVWCTTDEDFLAWDTTYAIASGMAEAYLEYWKDDAVTYVQKEAGFKFAIPNPETTGISRNFKAAGKIDGVVIWRGKTCIMEHKTVGVGISPTDDYWLKLAMDQQISMYLLGAMSLGHDVSNTVIYDVCRRPGIRPKQIKGERETPEQFKERLVDDMRTRPEFYFARREVVRFPKDLNAFADELWMMQRLLSECKNNNWWVRNTSQCNLTWRCEYLDVCLEDGLECPDGFEVIDNVHPELAGLLKEV